MTTLQWDTVHGRYRAVSGKREYRVFSGPEEASQALPWILVVREDDVHIHHGTYRSIEEAKRAAELWEGPPPPKG